MPGFRCAFVLVLFAGLTAPAAVQGPDDPAIRAAVERYYRALEAEDIDGYLALWSRTAQRPQPQSLKFLFDSGDERFFDIEIVRAVVAGDRLRVRVSTRRERTRPARDPASPPVVSSSVGLTAIAFVKEADDWKVVSEGAPADDLASALVAAPTPEARSVLLEAEADLVNTALVAAMSRIAGNAATMRNYPRAETLYRQVLELARKTGSAREEGETLQNLGNALYFQGRFPEAVAAYEERLAFERRRGADAAAAVALSGLATLRYSRAEYSEALTRYREALAIQERLDDRYASAATLIGVGNVRYVQGDYAGAIRDYSRSGGLYRAMFDSDGEARALEGLGRTYSAQGDYAAALSAFARVLAEGRVRADRSRLATANQAVADVHLRLGNVDAARRHYEESRDNFMAYKNESGAGRVWQGLGMTELLAARFEAGEQAYVRSAAMCDAVEDTECSAHAVVGLAFAQFAQDKLPPSIASYRKAIAAFTKLGTREDTARAEVGLSQALTKAGEIPAALEAAVRARHTAVALENDDILWRALTAEARALRKSPGADKSKALGVARAAAGVVDRMHESALAKPATAIPSDASAAFATLAVLQSETADPAGAWTSVSRMRAIGLRAALAVNERDIARGMNAEEREQESALASELVPLLAQAARERGLPKPDAARLADLDARIASATALRNAFMQDVYARFPELVTWRARAVPAPSDLPSTLTPGTVLIEFVVDDDDVLVVIASASLERGVAAFAVPIDRRRLAERVNALVQPGTLRDVTAWRKAAGPIVGLIPPQAWALIADASRIVVIPHDVISRVPFEALPVGDGFLGDRAHVVYAGSTAAVAAAAAIEPAPVTSMLGITSPELPSAAKERLQQTAPGWAIRTGDDAGRETSVVAGVYEDESVVLTGGAATEAAFRTKAPAASALHMAAPFRINATGPLFSPMLLSADTSELPADDDGVLEIREVMNLNLRARVALLSDGATTSMRDGAAAADVVQWAWLAGGVPSIVLARWGGDPSASTALLAEFHRRLRAGADPASALHAARTAIRQRPEWKAPFFWAGWEMMGK